MKDANIKKLASKVRAGCMGSALRQLNRVVTNAFESEMADVGLTLAQFSILTAILKMEVTSPSRLGKVLDLEKSTLSRSLDLMRRRGWVMVEGDSRAVRVSISSQGEALYKKAFPCWERGQQASRKILGKEAGEQLLVIVRSIQK